MGSIRRKGNAMEIGGYDTILHTSNSPTKVMTMILQALSSRWPAVRIRLNEQSFPAGILPQDFPEDSGYVLAAKDIAMEKHWDLTGGTLMDSGEGPVAFYYAKTPANVYEITVVTPADPQHDPFSGLIYEMTRQACLDDYMPTGGC
jgi:hypothetical protein